MISYRIVNPVTITIVNGTFDVGYYEPIMSIAVLAGTVISFATTGIELVLEICTGFALMFFTKSIINKESNLNRIKNEIRLFVYSLVMFLFHGFLTAYYLSKYISTLGNSAMFNAIGEHFASIIREMYMLANSLLLFLIR
uniref:Uncharacterized protein n=1 Tax=Acrobeloides nanus TaxID=290746 RepID=A0A914CRS9_9BILA